MRLPFLHVMTKAKYFQLVKELKSKEDTIKNLEMWYNRQLAEINKLRYLQAKEKERKIAYIHNFCHGKD